MDKNNSLSDSDYSDSNITEVPLVPNILDHISTEGVYGQELKLFGFKKLSDIKQCSICEKYYKLDMIVPNYDQESQCWHCLFWMNYSISTRKNVDGTYGLSIVDYILKCKDIHEIDKCKRNSDSGGCFLCEYNLGLPLTDIKELDKLSKFPEFPDIPQDDLDPIELDEDYYGMKNITIEI